MFNTLRCSLVAIGLFAVGCAQEEPTPGEELLDRYDTSRDSVVDYQEYVNEWERFTAMTAAADSDLAEQEWSVVGEGLMARGVQPLVLNPGEPFAHGVGQVPYGNSECDEYWSDAFFLCEEVYDHWYETIQRGACRIGAVGGWTACCGLGALK